MCSDEIVLLCGLIKVSLIGGLIFIRLTENTGWGKEGGKRKYSRISFAIKQLV